MKCKFHPARDATHYCEGCGVPICDIDAEEIYPGQFYCFQCAMLQTVSGVGTSLKERRARTQERKLEQDKKTRHLNWTWFHYFLLSSSVLILTMWSVILFGSPEAPAQRANIGKDSRVLIFLVDNGIKRYAHYEGGKYPEYLVDLIPKYVPLEPEQVPILDKLRYQTNPEDGYRLSLARPEPGEMVIVFTAYGIEHGPAEDGGS